MAVVRLRAAEPGRHGFKSQIHLRSAPSASYLTSRASVSSTNNGYNSGSFIQHRFLKAEHSKCWLLGRADDDDGSLLSQRQNVSSRGQASSKHKSFQKTVI